MADYRAMYYTLFCAVTAAIEGLQEAQQRTEEIYIGDDSGQKMPLRLEEKK